MSDPQILDAGKGKMHKDNKATYFRWWCRPQKPHAMPRKSPDIQHQWFITFLGKLEFDRAWHTQKNSGAALQEAAERKARFLAGVTADMQQTCRPRRDILSPQDLWHSEGSLRLSPAHPVGGWRRNPCSHLWNRAFYGPQWAALPLLLRLLRWCL